MGIEVYVAHIPASVTEEEIRKLFSVAGTVTSVHLVKDAETGVYRGCGYVRMSTEEEADEAIGLLHGALLGGGQILVKNAPPKQRQSTGTQHTARRRP